MKQRKIMSYLLDICYPNICDCCGRYISAQADVCTQCLKELAGLRTDYAAWLSDYRSAYAEVPLPWKDMITVYAYEGCARKGILAMKGGARNFGKHLAEELAKRAVSSLPLHEIDFVTWVPVSDARRRIQGYGHSEYLAKQLAHILHLPAKGGYLREEHTEERQHQQTAAERADFVQRFSAAKKPCEGACILLCDDILTTGSTMRRCTELLLQSGAKRVYGAAGLCTDKHRSKGDSGSPLPYREK